jgi:hypothetical protein
MLSHQGNGWFSVLILLDCGLIVEAVDCAFLPAVLMPVGSHCPVRVPL